MMTLRPAVPRGEAHAGTSGAEALGPLRGSPDPSRLVPMSDHMVTACDNPAVRG